MALDISDRTIFRVTWLALNISLASGVLLFFALSGGAELGSALALAFTVLFYFVSFPVHGCLTAACIVRCVRRGARNMSWVWIYLLTAVAVHIIVAARMQAFESIEHDVADWQREQELPAQSALEQAITQPIDVAAVRAALAAGADPDAVMPRNPLNHLVLAARRGHLDLVDALLDGGADPNRRSLVASGDRGISMGKPMPLDVAAISESEERVETVLRLLAAGADPAPSYLRLGACLRGDVDLLSLANLLGTAERVDEKGNGCMHLAAWGGHAHMIERLVRDGHDVNATNAAGRMPLDSALARNQFGAALALLKARANTTVPARLVDVMTRDDKDPGLLRLQQWLQDNPR